MSTSLGIPNTILVADDEPEVREFIQTGLRCRGYRVDGAGDGEEVLRYIREGRPVAAVLLDILMPRKSGMDTLREIRALDTDLPVIMVSGASSTMNVVEAGRPKKSTKSASRSSVLRSTRIPNVPPSRRI